MGHWGVAAQKLDFPCVILPDRTTNQRLCGIIIIFVT